MEKIPLQARTLPMQMPLFSSLKCVIMELGLSRKMQAAFLMYLPACTAKTHIPKALKNSKQDVAPFISFSAREVNEKNPTEAPPLAFADAPFFLIEGGNKRIGFEREKESRFFIVFSRLHGKNEYSGTGVG